MKGFAYHFHSEKEPGNGVDGCYRDGENGGVRVESLPRLIATLVSRQTKDYGEGMKSKDITLTGPAIDFSAARKSADEIAKKILTEPFLISWYDGIAGIGHPDVPECTGKPGWQTYGESRGGCLTINVNDGRYVLIYTETSIKTPGVVADPAAEPDRWTDMTGNTSVAP